MQRPLFYWKIFLKKGLTPFLKNGIVKPMNKQMNISLLGLLLLGRMCRTEGVLV